MVLITLLFWILLLYVNTALGGAPRYCGDKGQCSCYIFNSDLPLVDCSRRNLQDMPSFQDEPIIYESTTDLYLQDNDIANVTLNISLWRSLKAVNIRNNPIQCDNLGRLLATNVTMIY